MLSVVRREIGRLTSRPVYFVAMVLVPVFIAFFFVGLLNPGLPLKVPAAVVDLDHSQLSRKVTRSLDAMELIDVAAKPESYHEAMQMVQEGRILGRIIDALEGVVREEIKAPCAGLVFSQRSYSAVYPGTLIARLLRRREEA